jgi:hypothetical protein
MPRYISPQPQYFTDLGIPLTGGELYFYEPSTLIPKDTYSNAALSIPNTSPIVLATNGSPAVDIWLSGVYRVRLFDENGNLQWDKDPVGGDSGSLVAYSDWANGIEYTEVGTIVTGSNGRYYVLILAPSLNNNPISSPIYWTEARLLRVYNSSETYQIGTVVQTSDGYLWKAKLLTAGSTPALGSTFWDPATDGVNQLRLRVNPAYLAGPAAIPVNESKILTSTAAYSVGQRSLTQIGDQIIVSKDPDVNPNLTFFAGDTVKIGRTPASTASYDGIDYNINTPFTLTNNGTEWEMA